MPNERDVYTAIIYFNSTTGAAKPRPVVILNNHNNGWYTIAEITGEKPKDPPTYFSKFKETICKWQECGLDRPSWVKCHKGNIHKIEAGRLHQNIGIMDSTDFMNAVENIYTNNKTQTS